MIKIFTDNGADFPYNIEKIKKIPLYYYFEDDKSKIYGSDINLTNKEFFDGMRKGRVPRTASVNIEVVKDMFREELDKGNDIICISLSSGISSCFTNEYMAALELRDEYSNRKIEVIDSVIGSLPQAMLAIKSQKLAEDGYSFDDIVNYVQNNKFLYNYEIILDDLIYPVRGGRVNATVGSAINKLRIKPLIRVDKNGKTVLGGMVRGTKKVEDKLISNAFFDGKDNILEFGVLHTDNLDRALRFKERLLELGISEDIPVAELGPIIGSYAGPDSLGLVTKKKIRRK